jgi:hypothetical protein
MKIQIDGFDIEVITSDGSMSIKIIDASGKELSNNTYSQTLEGDSENTDIIEPDDENVETEENIEEPSTEKEDDETDNEETDDMTDDEETSERYIPDFKF